MFNNLNLLWNFLNKRNKLKLRLNMYYLPRGCAKDEIWGKFFTENIGIVLELFDALAWGWNIVK